MPNGLTGRAILLRDLDLGGSCLEDHVQGALRTKSLKVILGALGQKFRVYRKWEQIKALDCLTDQMLRKKSVTEGRPGASSRGNMLNSFMGLRGVILFEFHRERLRRGPESFFADGRF